MTDANVNFIGGNSFVERSRIVVLTAVAFIGGVGAAQAGPCTALIAEVDRYIQRSSAGATSGPTAPQSIGAQLHHQPTPSSVQNAVATARADAAAALDRARKADAEGDAAACTKAVDEAKLIYGLE